MVKNHRVHPFTLMKFPHLITNEEHTITTQPETNLIGFYTSESIHLNEGVSTVVIREGNSEFIEVRNDPQQNQYRVDYEAESYQGTGFILFNALDLNRVVTVEYEGLGSVVHKDNVNNLQSNVETVQNNLNTVKSDVNSRIDIINKYIGQHLFINHGTINPANFPLDYNNFNRLLLNVSTEAEMREVESMIMRARVLTLYIQAPGGGGAGSRTDGSSSYTGDPGQPGELKILDKAYSQEAITIILGSVGTGGTPTNNGISGGNTSVILNGTITALGGRGGYKEISINTGTNPLSGKNGQNSIFGRGGVASILNGYPSHASGYGASGASGHTANVNSARHGTNGSPSCILIVFRGAQ